VKRMCYWLPVFLATWWIAAGYAQEKQIRVPVTRDTWFSEVGKERQCNMGGSTRLKLKSIQEMSLIDIDPAPLRGRVINAATLHLRLAGDEILHRVTVSSFASEWVEGTSPRYAPQQGSSSFSAKKYPDTPWAFPNRMLTAVMLGQGGTVWRMADATRPDKHRWQQIAVDPSLLAARVAGISYGLFVFDDTGSEWSRKGEQFQRRIFPNRFVHSRESGPDNAPYLTVSLGPADTLPPPAPAGLTAGIDNLPAGDALVSWTTPEDRGPAGTIGFFVEVDGRAVPRYLIPAAGRPGKRVTMRLGEMELEPGARVKLAVNAVDAAGNVSPEAALWLRLSDKVPRPLPGKAPRPTRPTGPRPTLGGAKVAVVDPLDKVQPVTGKMIPEQPAEYLEANHLWNAGRNQVRLAAARNEFVGFQILFEGAVRGVRPSIEFEDDAEKIPVEFARFRYVQSKEGPLPDPVVPLAGTFDLPDTDHAVPGQTCGSLLCELYVPHDTAPGAHQGTLVLRTGKETLRIGLLLWVWDFTLPDFLSFLPEMNCYGLPQNERDYYRLAHRHRTVLNRVPYSQVGRIADGCAPKWDGQQLDWSEWDKRFGPYLDGSAFADLPRKGVPVDCFYLPLHENWPGSMRVYYKETYWADQAFRPGYREAFVEVAEQMARHFQAKRWCDTIFQCYLNNKVDFKSRGWSWGSAPWLLDEPANFQDYWALRYFGEAFHEGVRRAFQSGETAKLCYRCDISRPQWQRDTLDHVLDYNVVNGWAFRNFHRTVIDRKQAFGQIVVDYGSTGHVEKSNMQPVGWCLDSWTLGSDGVLPWQTIGTDASWQKADRHAMFYPGKVVKQPGPVASIRLKAYRRGQQDVEYLVMLAQLLEEPRWALGRSIRRSLRLAAQHRGTGAAGEDAGVVHYADLMPQDVWALRIRLARAISALHPKPKRKLVDLRTPPRDPAAGPPAYAQTRTGGPQVATAGEPDRAPGDTPDHSPPKEKPQKPAVVKVLQGRQVVYDAIIDPAFPDQNFGRVAEDNRLKRRDTCNAFLIRFMLNRLKLPPDAEIVKATVSFHVWDPSPKGHMALCAFTMKTPWKEVEATWERPARGQSWKGGKTFVFGVDSGPAGPAIIIPPHENRDTINPRIEYKLDVTGMVRGWLSGAIPNYGMAIAPVIDRAVDDGAWSRIQVLASEHRKPRHVPKLEVHVRE